MSKIHRRVAAMVCILLIPGGTIAAEDAWLSDSERQFFEALGVNAVVGGEEVKRDMLYGRLPYIARDAEQPLRSRIEALLAAQDRMKVTRQDVAELAARLADGSPIITAWEMLGDWIIRALEAKAEHDAILEQILADASRRAPSDSLNSPPTVDVDYDEFVLKLVGSGGDQPLGTPVVQIILHRKPLTGEWTWTNVASSVILRMMGVKNLDFEAAFQGIRLAAVQEMVENQPLVLTQLLPTVEPEEDLTLHIPLPPGEVADLDRIEFRIWSAQGRWQTNSFPGLAQARQKAIEHAERERLRRLAIFQAWLRRKQRIGRNDYAKKAIYDYIGNGIKNATSQERFRQQFIIARFNDFSLGGR
jgi:hypothetical protein